MTLKEYIVLAAGVAAWFLISVMVDGVPSVRQIAIAVLIAAVLAVAVTVFRKKRVKR